MFLRALRVCCPDLLEAELGKIRNISSLLKYPSHFIDKAFDKAKKTFYGYLTNNDFNIQNLLVLPFYSQFLNIPRLLKPLGINVVFRNSTLENILIKNSPRQQVGCIYEIPCKHCNQKYVGQSGKELATRIKQHKYNVRTGNTASSLFHHMNNCNHTIDWNGAKEIMYCKDIIKRDLVESCIIKENCLDLMNTSPGLYKLDNLLVNNIVKQLPLR